MVIGKFETIDLEIYKNVLTSFCFWFKAMSLCISYSFLLPSFLSWSKLKYNILSGSVHQILWDHLQALVILNTVAWLMFETWQLFNSFTSRARHDSVKSSKPQVIKKNVNWLMATNRIIKYTCMTSFSLAAFQALNCSDSCLIFCCNCTWRVPLMQVSIVKKYRVLK